MPRKLNNRLAELRGAGVLLSQEHVAKIIGVDAATVSRHESGARAMTKEQILAYAALYRVPSHELFFTSSIA
ncbi:MAG TPA: helix-turn-helix transcriptional regulator [Gemmatimonadaceae bacterium]|nr:helix-turn-helix transcriptional regulator [Gemmatimonadaceae bacterium]